MSTHTTRERWLLGATIVSGLVALLSHGGGLTGCSTTVRPVAFQNVRAPLEAGQRPDLVLTSASSTPEHPDTARIERGSLMLLRWRPGGGGPTEVEAALAGFDPVRRLILVSTDGEATRRVDPDLLESLVVLGDSPTSGYAGNGALIGGLTGAVVGGVAGASVGGSYGGVCAAGFGVSGGLVGSGVGAGVGAIAAPGRARRAYRLDARHWQIAPEQPNARERPAAPWLQAQPASGGEAP